jgi:uncharacterized Tic20 family protein
MEEGQAAAKIDRPLTSDEKIMVMIAHLGPLFFSFIPPLIVWIMKKDEPQQEFVADQAKESLNFQITVAIALLVCGLLTCVVIGVFLLPVVAVAALVLCIMATVKATAGVRYRYPFTLRLI